MEGYKPQDFSFLTAVRISTTLVIVNGFDLYEYMSNMKIPPLKIMDSRKRLDLSELGIIAVHMTTNKRYYLVSFNHTLYIH